MGTSPYGRLIRLVDHDYGAPFFIGTGVVAALLWSAASPSNYETITLSLWQQPQWNFSSINSLHGLVVNGLMTVFFLAIGLELSRELRTGALMRPAHALPPVLGALGGMLGTALLSLLAGALTHSYALRHGWGVPMATDIAFTLGVLALAGRRLPPQLRIFLLTLAIADDAFSVLVLALTGASHIHSAGVIALIVVVAAAWWSSQRWPRSWLGVGFVIAIWLCFVWANVEPPLSGVVGGLAISFNEVFALNFERVLSRWSTALVLPLFALVSCGIHWQALSLRGDVLTIIVAMIVIRIIGKVLGITGGVALAALIGFKLHRSISWRTLAAAAVLCAIGFTVPLLFADQLFGPRSVTYGAITLGLLASSLIAAVLGITLLRIGSRTE
ncbi:MAG: Na+/H+ antiporter NhaA [Acidimicrobiales bacterium]